MVNEFFPAYKESVHSLVIITIFVFQVVEYVAEFWSTITNLVLIFTGIWGIYETRKQGFELRYRKWIPIRYYI